MQSRRPPLSYDVFVAPEKPFIAPPPRVGDPPAWDPTTSTLIFGARDAVLVDPLMTVREATALADWVTLHDRRRTTIYITHGHGDHHLGLSVVLDRFPHARAMATAGTVEQMRREATPQVLNDGLRARFPGQIADTIALAETLDAGHLELEGSPSRRRDKPSGSPPSAGWPRSTPPPSSSSFTTPAPEALRYWCTGARRMHPGWSQRERLR